MDDKKAFRAGGGRVKGVGSTSFVRAVQHVKRLPFPPMQLHSSPNQRDESASCSRPLLSTAANAHRNLGSRSRPLSSPSLSRLPSSP